MHKCKEAAAFYRERISRECTSEIKDLGTQNVSQSRRLLIDTNVGRCGKIKLMPRIEPSKSIYQQITSDPSVELDFSQFECSGSAWVEEVSVEIGTVCGLVFDVFPVSDELRTAYERAMEDEDVEVAHAECEELFLAGRAGDMHLNTGAYRTEVSYSRSDRASNLLLDDVVEKITNSTPDIWLERRVRPKQSDCGTTELFFNKKDCLIIGTVLRNGQPLGFIRVAPHVLESTNELLPHLTNTVFVGEDIDTVVVEFKKRYYAGLNPFAELSVPDVDGNDTVSDVGDERREKVHREQKLKTHENVNADAHPNTTFDPRPAHLHSVSQAYRNKHEHSHADERHYSHSQGYRRRN